MFALDGIKVLDLSRVLAGPWCTQTLADMGADVWKIEPPVGGDDTRSWMPPDLDGESTYFMCANRSKRSVAVDLKHPDGAAAVQALAAEADILVENFRRGALDKFGLGYKTLSAANPGLIYCSISGYGRTGPRADEPGYDFVIQAESGLMSITGEIGGQPMKLGVAIADLVTGMNATQGILAALIARGRTGRGQLIDVSLLDSAVAALANVGSGHLATGRDPKRLANAHATIVPYQLFDTADGAVAIAVGNNKQFQALCDRVIERPDLPADTRFRTNELRVINREALIPILSAVFRSRPTESWLTLLRAAGVPAGAVRDVAEALASPEILARGMVADVPDARHETLKLMTSPIHLRGTPARAPTAPPRLGEHTRSVLREMLKLDDGQIAALVSSGAVAELTRG